MSMNAPYIKKFVCLFFQIKIILRDPKSKMLDIFGPFSLLNIIDCEV